MDEKNCGNCGWDGVTPLDSGKTKMMESLEEPTQAVWGKAGEWTTYNQSDIPREGEWDSQGPGSDVEMDDTMVRGCLVFYVDVGQLPPYKAEAYVERMKDQLNSKKGLTRIRRDQEVFFVPVRNGLGTRVKYIPFN